jgi:hypothetical protein
MKVVGTDAGTRGGVPKTESSRGRRSCGGSQELRDESARRGCLIASMPLVGVYRSDVKEIARRSALETLPGSL